MLPAPFTQYEFENPLLQQKKIYIGSIYKNSAQSLVVKAEARYRTCSTNVFLKLLIE